MVNTSHRLVFFCFMIMCSVMLHVSAQAKDLPAPGDRITNIASGDFVDTFGNLRIIHSNPVELTVSEVRSFTFVTSQQQVGLIGGHVSFSHTLTNTGNIRDTYQLSINQLTSDQFNLNTLAVYADRDNNGVPDDDVNLLSAGQSVSLDATKHINLIVTGSIPTTVNNANQAVFTLTASSTATNPPAAQTVTDTTTVTSGAVLTVKKSQNKAQAKAGDPVTYQLTYENKGNSLGYATLTDVLSAQLSYQNNSATWNNTLSLTDADDTVEHTVEGQTIAYQYNAANNTLRITLRDIPAQSSGVISFTATVLEKDGNIPNTVSYSQTTAAGNTILNTQTNTVILNVIPNAGVVLNNSETTTDNVGEPSAAPNNFVLINQINAGQQALFTNVVHNTGNSTDNYNLTYTTTDLPECATVRFYAADGKTLLTDTNNDGIVDTGAIAEGLNKVITLSIDTSAQCQISSPITVNVTATSSSDANQTDRIRNQLNSISQNTTDLYNLNASGTGANNIDNNGEPWIVKQASSTAPAVFELVAHNIGSNTNNYYLNATGNSTQALPSGWQVTFYEQTSGSCTTLGDEITRTGVLLGNATFTYCAVVQPSDDAAPTQTPIYFGIVSSINNQRDVIKNAVTLATGRQLLLTSDQSGAVPLGGTATYSHTLKNTGNLAEGTASTPLTLSLDESLSNGFINSLYYDSNNNGVLDANDQLIANGTDLATLGNTPQGSSSVGLAPNESIRFFVKVQAPLVLTNPNNASSQVKLIVTPTASVNDIALAPISNTDITTVTVQRVALHKTQAANPSCGSDLSTLSFSTDEVQVKPNECVVYRITATNQSSNLVTEVIIRDSTPSFTKIAAPAPSVTQGTMDAGSATLGASGNIQANIGSLTAGQAESLFFNVKVD